MVAQFGHIKMRRILPKEYQEEKNAMFAYENNIMAGCLTNVDGEWMLNLGDRLLPLEEDSVVTELIMVPNEGEGYFLLNPMDWLQACVERQHGKDEFTFIPTRIGMYYDGNVVKEKYIANLFKPTLN